MLQTTNPSLISTNSFDLVTSYCVLDDFFKLLEQIKVFGSDSNKSNSGRKATLSISEIATITLIGCIYESGCLKALYKLLWDKFRNDFKLPRYQNFVNLMNKRSAYLLKFICLICNLNNKQQGIITFCDSTKLEVAKIYREHKHKTMKLLASKSKTTTGWFYGLRLHVLCDQAGNLMQIKFTTATVGERQVLDEFLGRIKECIVVADAGYLSKELEQKAQENNNILLAAVRKNMKTLATIWNNKCMNMRSRIESVFSELKERFNLVSTLSRSVNGYFAHYIRAIFGYMILD